MQSIIQQKLHEIEQQADVAVLYAVESGSRAWGFASPDSDYDVRFVYVRRRDDYLRLEKTSDVLEWQLDETLDISGWDLKKALQLMYKSNPTIFEWDRSPVVYRSSPFWQQIRQNFAPYFSVKSGLYHDLSMASSNYRTYLQEDTVRLKKYFYVLRPVLAAQWIAERRCPPPILFDILAESVLPAELRQIVAELKTQKMQTPEIGRGPRIPELNAYFDRVIPELMTATEAEDMHSTPGWEPLNRMFLDGIRFFENEASAL